MYLRKFLIAAATILPFTASAVQPSKVFKDDDFPQITIVPDKVSYDGKPSYLLKANSDESEYTIERIDANLDILESFTIANPSVALTITNLVPPFKYESVYSSIATYAASSVSDAIALVKQYYPDGFRQINIASEYSDSESSILFIKGNTLPNGVYDGMSTYDLEIPIIDCKLGDEYAYYIARNGVIEFRKKFERCTGELDYDSPESEWSVYSSQDVECYYRLYHNIGYHDYQINFDASILATQTLFNSDKDYEVLVPVVVLRNEDVTSSYYGDISLNYTDAYGEEHSVNCYRSKVRSKLVQITGVKAINAQTGATVTAFEFPKPISANSDIYVYVKIIDNRRYLTVEYEDYDTDEEIACFYNLDEQSAVKAPVMTKRVSVKPSIVNRGEDIMVNVDGNDSISAITLTGMNGQTMQHIKGNGAKSTAVKTGRLGSGVHIVGVQTTDGANTYNKIVVK